MFTGCAKKIVYGAVSVISFIFAIKEYIYKNVNIVPTHPSLPYY